MKSIYPSIFIPNLFFRQRVYNWLNRYFLWTIILLFNNISFYTFMIQSKTIFVLFLYRFWYFLLMRRIILVIIICVINNFFYFLSFFNTNIIWWIIINSSRLFFIIYNWIMIKIWCLSIPCIHYPYIFINSLRSNNI